MQQATTDLFDLQIDQQTSIQLNETAKWGRFLAIVGFVFSGLMLIALVSALTLGSLASDSGGSPSSMAAVLGGGIVIFIYFVFALLFFIPCLYLYNFSSKMQAALRANQQETLNIAFANLKSCFKFLGILTIIMLVIWGIGLVSVVGMGIAAAT